MPECLAEVCEEIPENACLPTFPIWSMEFGATYPYIDETPHSVGVERLGDYRGSHGLKLSQLRLKNGCNTFPRTPGPRRKSSPTGKSSSSAKTATSTVPIVTGSIRGCPSFSSFVQSSKARMELQGRKAGYLVLRHPVSGVWRSRRETVQLAVACCDDDHPGSDYRLATTLHDSARVCRLQSLGELKHLPPNSTAAFKALGNAVNTEVVELIVTALNRRAIAPSQFQCHDSRADCFGLGMQEDNRWKKVLDGCSHRNQNCSDSRPGP